MRPRLRWGGGMPRPPCGDQRRSGTGWARPGWPPWNWPTPWMALLLMPAARFRLVATLVVTSGLPCPPRWTDTDGVTEKGWPPPPWDWPTPWTTLLLMPAAMLKLFATLVLTSGTPPNWTSPAIAGPARVGSRARHSRVRRIMVGLSFGFRPGRHCPGLVGRKTEGS